MRRTKIIATIGPATAERETLIDLVNNGADVIRFNFSHGTHEKHAEWMELVREISKEIKKPIGILQDLQGPKIRVGTFADGPIKLEPGKEFVITTRKVPGNVEEVSTSYQNLPKDVEVGTDILLADGLLKLKATEVTSTDVRTEVIDGGELSNNKGINLPQASISAPCLSLKDLTDLKFGLDQGVDSIALSFVRQKEDVLQLKEMAMGEGVWPFIICKIEKHEAVKNLEEILEESNGLMVARGDLGVEMPMQDVPILQKKIIRICNQNSKTVVTATQMLESMIENPRPTRAESSDVANAIYDGTDAVMLSGETATGKHPVAAVSMMAIIANKTEEDLDLNPQYHSKADPGLSITNSVSHAACHLGRYLGAKAIITFTEHGFTALMTSKYRQPIPVIAATPHEKIMRRMCLFWGVQSLRLDEEENMDNMIKKVEEIAIERGIVAHEDLVVIISRSTRWV